MSLRNFRSLEFGAKFQREVPKFLEVGLPDFLMTLFAHYYNIVIIIMAMFPLGFERRINPSMFALFLF